MANDFFEWKKSFKPCREMTSTAENGPLSGYGIGRQVRFFLVEVWYWLR
jgi:hypothetical protein